MVKPTIVDHILFAFTTTSCKNNEGDGNGTPVIKYIRLTDPALADSTFTDVNPGTMIAVIGENLSGVMEVYINGQEISFNPSLIAKKIFSYFLAV